MHVRPVLAPSRRPALRRDEEPRPLADLPLRIRPSETLEPVEDDLSTLSGLLAAIARRRVRLVESSRGVRVLHAHMHPDLMEPVRRFESDLRVWLRLRDQEVPVAFRAQGWGEAVRLHAAWVALGFEPPATPVEIRQGEWVQDWDAYRAGLIARLFAGPDAPSADRVRDDLSALFGRYAHLPGGEVIGEVPSVPLAQAA